ncbi:MAG: hypothetical protein ACOVSR_12660 [Bacteroidia bacterium]
MKKTLLNVIIILLFCSQIFAQKSLIFLNTKTNETIEVSVGQTLSIKFKGYNNQLFYVKNIVTEINDSNIVLGHETDEPPVWAQKLSKKFEPNYRVVDIKDIVAFRRITAGRTLGKSFLSSTIVLGTFFGTINLFRNTQLETWQTVFLSLGIGMATSVINAFVLPENPKNKISDNWVITVRN